MPESNHVQTLRPPSMRIIDNPHGTAPGLAGKIDRCLIFALPGPPGEMKPMFHNHVRSEIDSLQPEVILRVQKVNSYGVGEALAAQKLGDLLERDREPMVGITAGSSIVTTRVRYRGPPEQAEREVLHVVKQIEAKWYPYAFSRDDISLPEVVGELLLERGRTLCTAESCTGGWVGKLITDVPGSSAYYQGGWVTYSDDLKQSCLDVPGELLDDPGAVSAETAEALATNANKKCKADYSLAITGIAGPGGETSGKPVGTVFIALGVRVQDETHVQLRRFEFSGSRNTVRIRAAMSALQMLRFELLSVTGDWPLLWEIPVGEARRT